MISLDDRAKFNCEVCRVLYVRPRTDMGRSQGIILTLFVSMPPSAPSLRNESFFILSFFLDHFVRGLYWCITFNRSPQVRPVLYLKRYDYLLEVIAHGHRQYRHLERAEDCHRDHGCHMGVQHWVLHSK
jgi:hypothetical protein